MARREQHPQIFKENTWKRTKDIDSLVTGSGLKTHPHIRIKTVNNLAIAVRKIIKLRGSVYAWLIPFVSLLTKEYKPKFFSILHANIYSALIYASKALRGGVIISFPRLGRRTPWAGFLIHSFTAKCARQDQLLINQGDSRTLLTLLPLYKLHIQTITSRIPKNKSFIFIIINPI